MHPPQIFSARMIFSDAFLQHLMLAVAQRLHRRDDHRIAGVDADRIDVFHVADDDGIVVGIAHDLILDFLEPGDAALDQTLVHR